MSSPLYHLIDSGRKFGRYTRRELATLLADGEIHLDTLCIRAGDDEIHRIRDLFEDPAHEAHATSGNTRLPLPHPEVTANQAPPRATEAASKETWEENEDDADTDEEDEEDDEDDDVEAWEEEETEEPVSAPAPAPDPDEIICSLHPSLFGYPKLLSLTLFLGTMSLASMVWGSLFQGSAPLLQTLLMGSTGGTLGWLILFRMFDNYYISRSRAEIVRGIIARSSNEVRIADVRRIDVEKKGWLGYLNVGDVKLSSAGTGGFDVVFANVRGGHRIKKILRRIQKDPKASRRSLLGKPWI